MGWRVASFVMLFVLAGLALLLLVTVLNYPGRVARKREHPQASAIETSAWLGLLTGMVTWVVACIWAHSRPWVGEEES
ncbi:MAG: DUF3302 domain-containing protein [Planctomycetota bacterium]